MSSLAQAQESSVLEMPFAAPYVFVLAVVDGADPQAVYRLALAETIVGCQADANLVLEGEKISGHHCALRCDAGQCHIVDTGSESGTIVNARRLVPGRALRLRHLDEVEIGTTRFLFLSGRFIDRPQRGH